MKQEVRECRAALVATASTSFMVPFMMSAVAISLPAVQHEFQASAVELSLIEISYIMSLAIILLPISKLADMFGRKKVFAWGIIIFSLASLSVSLSWSIRSFIGLRLIQGIGAAMINSTGLAILTTLYPSKKRGRAMGLVVASVYTGLSAGPFIGGALTTYIGWRSIFYLCLPLGLLCVYLVTSGIRQEWAPSKGESFDFVGSLLYALSITGLMSGLIKSEQIYFSLALFFVGLIALVLFWHWEQKIKNPLLDLTIFTRNISFTLSSLATLINYAATFGIIFLLNLFLQEGKGLSAMVAGAVLVVQPVVQAIFSPLAGHLADRFSPFRLASLGMSLIVLGLYLLTFIGIHTDLLFILAILFVLGLGFALFSSPNLKAIMGSVQGRHYAVASSLVATMRTLGMALSMTIVSIVFALILGAKPVSIQTISSFLQSCHHIFIIFTILCLLGVICSLGREGKDFWLSVFRLRK